MFFVGLYFGLLDERRQALPDPMQRFVLGVSMPDELSRAVSNSDEYLLRYLRPFVSVLLGIASVSWVFFDHLDECASLLDRPKSSPCVGVVRVPDEL